MVLAYGFAFSQKKVIYTCPMHPEVQMSKPGNCPKCGMTLVKKTITVTAPKPAAKKATKAPQPKTVSNKTTKAPADKPTRATVAVDTSDMRAMMRDMKDMMHDMK